ncbi:MAG: FAD-dependent oxidoreductase, partial [Dermatophilaceae bacterium]
MLHPVRAAPRVVVVGGGIAGLAAALDVLEAVPLAEVTVLEGSDRFGGKLRLAEVGGHAVDVGAEAVLATRSEVTGLAARVGAAADLVAPSITAASVWSRGALHPLPRRTVMGVPTQPALA